MRLHVRLCAAGRELYSSPYMDARLQAAAVSYLHGLCVADSSSSATPSALPMDAIASSAADICAYLILRIRRAFLLADRRGEDSAVVSSSAELLVSCDLIVWLRRLAPAESFEAIQTGVFKLLSSFTDDIENPKTVTIVLQLKCINAILRCSNQSLPGPLSSVCPVSADDRGVLGRLCVCVLRMQTPSSALFREAVEQTVSGAAPPLVWAGVTDCNMQYGKFSSLTMGLKWICVNHCVAAMCRAPPPPRDSPNTFLSDFSDPIAASICDQMEICPQWILPDMYDTCCVVLAHLARQLPPSEWAARSSSLLEACWSNCVSDESTEPATVFSFSSLVFNIEIMRHLDNSVALVSKCDRCACADD